MKREYNYADTPNSNLVCCICRMPFVEPTTTRTCSHTFCRECIVHAAELVPQCPVDRSPLTLDDLLPANPIVRSLVDELIVECVHLSAGCTFTCQRQLLAAHLKDTCQYTEVACTEGECDQVVLRKDAGNHSHKCVHRQQECDGCGVKVRVVDMEDHHAVCPEKTASCPACSSVFPRPQVTAHAATCPDLVIPCTHNSNGCPWTGPRHTLLSTHIPSCPYESIKEFFALNNSRLSTLTETNSTLKSKVEELEGVVKTMKCEMQAVKTALGPWYRPDGLHSPSSARALPSSHRYSLTPSPTFTNAPNDALPSFPPSRADPNDLAQYFPPEAIDTPHNHHQLEIPQYSHPHRRSPTHRASTSLSHFSDVMYPYGFSRQAAAPSLQVPVAPIDLSTTLEGSLRGLRESIVTLSASVDSLARRHDIALTDETMKLNEEVMSLRANVNGLRMQVHTIMVDRNAQVTGRVGDSAGAGWNEASGGGGWTGTPPMSTRFHNPQHAFPILAPMMPSTTKL